MPRLPRLAILLGALGLIPFLVTGLAAMLPDPGVRRLMLLLTYGAVILSFLGGVHWGFAVLAPAPLPMAAEPAGDWARAERYRLLGGIGFSLLGWFALAMAAYASPAAGLSLMLIGFAVLPFAEYGGQRRGWVPRGYMWLRWGLSLVVVGVLGAVLVVRLLGLAVGG